jgi:hypothetical protein
MVTPGTSQGILVPRDRVGGEIVYLSHQSGEQEEDRGGVLQASMK